MRLALIIVAAIFSLPSFAKNDYYYSSIDNYPLSQNTYGSIGLIQNPSARFAKDGELTFGISSEQPYNRLFATAQFFPWLEATIRYTEGTYQRYNIGSLQTWKDKGFDFKVKLLEEGTNNPALALGIIDFGGTGAYASEYIVASHRFKNIDLTYGIGWGNFGGIYNDVSKGQITNPLSWFSDDFDSRESFGGLGGRFGINRMFRGENASFFGGVEYYTKIPNLSLKFEYDSNQYLQLVGKELDVFKTGNIFERDSNFNFGLNYRANITDSDKIDISFGYVRGNTIYANVNFHNNLNILNKKYFGPQEVLNKPYLEPFSELNEEWKKYLSETIMWQMGNVGLVTHRVIFNKNELQVEVSQGVYPDTMQAIELASRVLGNNSPVNIDRITVINLDNGVETLRASIPRDKLVRSVAKGPLDYELVEFNKITTLASEANIRENEYLYPNFYWDIKPHALGTLQHQERFYFWQLEALLHAEYQMMDGVYISTDIGINIANNYDEYTYHVPDGELHHVRQDRRKYLTEGESGIRRLDAEYMTSLGPNVYAKLVMGYLEWMYGGFGGEVLYIPYHKHWAIGLESYWVKQRDFDQRFKFQDYETVTSYFNFYYDLPFYNLRLKTKVGKFLGKDKGVSVDISRKFQSGARLGARVALTDCDTSCVGEGSFNKWAYFSLPMDLFYTKSSTRGKGGYEWSPLTKDAGQTIQSKQLYDVVTSAQDEVLFLQKTNLSLKRIFSGFSTKPKNKV